MTTDTALGRHREAGSGTEVCLRSLFLAGLTAGACAWAAHRLSDTALPTGPAAALEVGALALAAGALAWLSLLLVLTAVSTLPGLPGRAAHHALRQLAPRGVGAALTVLLGAGFAGPQLSAVTFSPAEAAPATSSSAGAATEHEDPLAAPAFGDRSGEHVARSGWTPAPPAPRPQLPAATARLVGGGRAPSAEVVVRSGDTLWDIVARHHGGNATATAIAAEVPRWHDANRTVIGDDMNRLVPGQVLLPPSSTTENHA